MLADFGLAENIASYDGGEPTMTNFPMWIEARTKNDDNFPFLWINRHNPLSMRGVAGTYWYTAPEVFRKERYSFGVDYWSIGVIYYELVTGHVRAFIHPYSLTDLTVSLFPFSSIRYLSTISGIIRQIIVRS